MPHTYFEFDFFLIFHNMTHRSPYDSYLCLISITFNWWNVDFLCVCFVFLFILISFFGHDVHFGAHFWSVMQTSGIMAPKGRRAAI